MSLRVGWPVWGWRLGLLLALWAGLVVATLPAGPPGPDWFWQADKVRHAAAFVGFWWLGGRCQVKVWWLLLGLLAYGVGIEWAQSFTPDRDASWGDVLADLAGLLIGWRVWPVPARQRAGTEISSPAT